MITAFLKAYWKPLGALIIVVGALWMAHHLGYSSGYDTSDAAWNDKWSKRDAADLKADNERRKQSTEQSNRLAAAQALAAANYLNGVKDGKAAADRTIADYRNANLRLQKRFDGLQCVSRSMSNTSTAGSVSDAAGDCGLSDADVEFLIRFAQHADDTARQLAAAQQIISKWWVIINGKEQLNK